MITKLITINKLENDTKSSKDPKDISQYEERKEQESLTQEKKKEAKGHSILLSTDFRFPEFEELERTAMKIDTKKTIIDIENVLKDQSKWEIGIDETKDL